MINEVIEVQSYIKGENINNSNLLRICYMLAKWYKCSGLSHIETRRTILDWSKKYNVFIKYNVNSIIYKAAEDKNELEDNTVVKINQKDISEINDRFDSKNLKLTALAMLCYAKAFADKNKEFSISSVTLGAWTGLKDATVRRLYIKKMLEVGYIIKVDISKQNCGRYKLLVDIHNSGEFILKDNDIHELFSSIFC